MHSVSVRYVRNVSKRLNGSTWFWTGLEAVYIALYGVLSLPINNGSSVLILLKVRI